MATAAGTPNYTEVSNITLDYQKMRCKKTH